MNRSSSTASDAFGHFSQLPDDASEVFVSALNVDVLDTVGNTQDVHTHLCMGN